MSYNPRFKNAQLNTATTLFGTGSAPQVGAGTAVLMQNVTPGTLSAKVVMACKTSTLTMVPSWQVSTDNSTWYAVKTLNNAAQVGPAAGTGSTVTTTIAMCGDHALSGYRYARAVVTTGVTTCDGTVDSYAINYSWLQSE